MTLSALGIFSAAGAGGAVAASDYELISTTVLGSAASSFTFSGLGTYSSTYKHLQVRAVVRSNRASVEDLGAFYYNGDEVNSNYRYHSLNGSGSTVFADNANLPYIPYFAAASAPANQFTAFVADILDPYSTTKNTTQRLFLGQGVAGFNLGLQSGLWNNTASLTSIKYSVIGQFVAGSRFSIYGIKG
jgi:hypothetical protein